MSQNSELFLIFWLEGKRSMGEEELHIKGKRSRENNGRKKRKKEKRRVGEVQLTIFCER